VARGDHGAFEAFYDALGGPVYGLIRKVKTRIRDGLIRMRDSLEVSW
jgi:hypothetical protein